MLSNAMNPVHAVFNGGRARAFLCRSRYVFVAAAFLFLAFQVKRAWFFPGFCVAFFGELIQVWSFASLEKNRVLATRGPYVLVRNPMYIGRFFLILGALMVTGHIWAAPALAVLYYLYAVNRTKREERRLLALFGDVYGEYCGKVRRFVPSLRAWERRSLFFFKWNLLIQNHGLQNMLATLGCFMVLYLFAV
ncbi:MAG: isoprenylcysteine carboxylmethyltransferase family protein [Deltaproteobacteria bacterium]|nr:isoprenylcysteine carboxylmethyltransferase family protein [Deltaproteobacteria bacterium]